MNDADVPRAAHGKKHVAVLKVPKARIRFQIAPGNSPGIAGVPYEILVQNKVQSTGKTNKRGEVVIDYNYLYGVQRPVVRIFDTEYEINTSVVLEPTDEIIGVQKRLYLLGYMTGYLLDTKNEPDGSKSERYHQAILNFKSDFKVAPIDTEVGGKFANLLKSVVGG